MSGTVILVTGAAGYIGSVLCRQLLERGFSVRGLDNLLFGGESLVELAGHERFEFIKADIRNQDRVQEALQGVSAVVHLAAIVGDKACKLQAEEATEIMDVATRNIYHAAANAGVKHFVFASTCSNYGIMEGVSDPLLNEDAPLRPQSHYARLKVQFEEYLLSQPVMPRTLLRFSTVYGLSPRVRFDLSVNHFTRDLSLGRPLLIFGADTWRPYCHVQDLARSVVMVLEAGPESTNGKVFNVGDSEENYTKRSLVEEILKFTPNGEVEFQERAGTDPRNYRIDFSRIRAELGFEITRRVPDGVEEIHRLIHMGLLPDPDHPKYVNA